MRANGRKLRMFNYAKAVGKKAEVEMGRSRGSFWESGSLKSPAKGNLGKKAEVELTEVVGSLRVQ